jgi:C4-dicarboxylate-specific signal transduction histidine kinase
MEARIQTEMAAMGRMSAAVAHEIPKPAGSYFSSERIA